MKRCMGQLYQEYIFIKIVENVSSVRVNCFLNVSVLKRLVSRSPIKVTPRPEVMHRQFEFISTVPRIVSWRRSQREI